MKRIRKDILLIQSFYVLIALFVALILWLVLPEASQASINIHQWELGGAIAGFAYVFYILNRAGLIEDMIKDAKQKVKAGIKNEPNTSKEYNELFDNFIKCDYFAFNPPFKIEDTGKRFYKEAVKTHAKRYRDSEVSSRYLFFTKSSYKRALRFFKDVEKKVGKKLLDNDICVKLWQNPPNIPGYTFFTGYKEEDNPYCIFYPTVSMQSGVPELVIYVEGAKDFLSILNKHFQENWTLANKKKT